MSVAAIALLAFAAAVVLGTAAKLNVGLLAVVLAFAVVGPLAGLGPAQVAAGFPAGLFLTLVAVTLLFSQARANGTLARLATLAVRLCGGRAGWIPVAFFALALALSALGPGNIAAVALLAPLAMSVASRTGVPPFLMALMVCGGANAGAFSPVAPTGLIAADLMARIGLAGHEWRTFAATLAAQAGVAFAGYLAFGGARLIAREPARTQAPEPEGPPRLERRQRGTALALAAVLAGVLLAGLDVTLCALVASLALALLRAADTRKALQEMPWNAILLVCGVSVLVSLVSRTGGMDLFAGLLAGVSSARSVTAVIGFVTGAVSVYSSSSGVVMPAFLPTVPALAAKLGGVDPLAIASAINVGSHLVDVSPLSTLGALCIAASRDEAGRNRLFNQMLAWGLSMCVVGALVCWGMFGG